MSETLAPNNIEARHLSAGMVIINEDEHPAQEDEVAVLETKFLKGKREDLDQVMYRCIYGWAYLYCNQTIMVKHLH
jgi:hypothetical protein